MWQLALSELVQWTGGTLSLGSMPPLAGDALPIGRVVTHSQKIEPSDVFWALSGLRHDGSDYIAEAYSRGASGVVSARQVEPWAGRFSVQVEDALGALWMLAARLRDRFDGEVVAVTGSVGKTTAREMIHSVLGRQLCGTASPHNYNNHIGVPLSMLGWNELDDYAVLELGANHRGEIGMLAALAQPHVGVVTCVGQAHLGEFGSQQAVAEAKAELLSELPEEGWAVLSGDDPWLRRMAARCRCRILWVGRSADCDLVATQIQSRQGELSFVVDGVRVSVPVWGRHHLTSALAALGVGRVLGCSLAESALALGRYQSVPQRCQVSRVGEYTVINDTYNSSPQAMRAALELLRDYDAPGRRVVVCGDMRELGEWSHYCHRELGRQVVTLCGADLLVACGDYAGEVICGAADAGMPASQLAYCQSPLQLWEILRQHLVAEDVVLVKGSRALALERLIESLETTTRVAA